MTGFGAYGKMPALGDFFRIAPPSGFVDIWDPWIQERLLDLRGALGEGWREAYLIAPIWRFTLSAGTAGEGAAMGVLMPSVDRVGRDFPLTLVAAVPAVGDVFALHAAAGENFVALEEIALAALGDEMTLEKLTAALAKVTVADAPVARILGRGPGHLAIETTGDAGPALLAAAPGSWSRPSVWGAVLGGKTRVLVSEGLPGPEHAAALFDAGASLWADSAMPMEARG